MEYLSNYQIFGNQYYEKAKQRRQPPKLHQTESTKVRQHIWFQSQPIRNDLKIFRFSANKQIPHTHTHTHTPCLMMGEVSLETSPKNIMIQDLINSENSMNTTESTNAYIFKRLI